LLITNIDDPVYGGSLCASSAWEWSNITGYNLTMCIEDSTNDAQFTLDVSSVPMVTVGSDFYPYVLFDEEGSDSCSQVIFGGSGGWSPSLGQVEIYADYT